MRFSVCIQAPMRFFLFLLLLLGCGKKTVYTYPPAPANEASPEVQAELNTELDKLQKEFADLNVKVDLKRLPVVVAQLPMSVMGRCQYKGKSEGAYIILSPVLFWENPGFEASDAVLFEKEFVRVLIHEIGHCYFGRKHEAPTFFESPGNAFELRSGNGSVTYDKIPRSLMPAESSYRMPKSLRKYYLAELVRQVKSTDPLILDQYSDMHVVDANEKSDTIKTTDEEGTHVSELLECTGTEHSP